jgi:hypothetical protein
MIAELDYGLPPDASEDHFLGLEQAQLEGSGTSRGGGSSARAWSPLR